MHKTFLFMFFLFSLFSFLFGEFWGFALHSFGVLFPLGAMM